MPFTPTSLSALRTSSSRNGLMIAVISFIQESPANYLFLVYAPE
jgi:hypothetical protein